nr:hypothetical protein [Tanacetum cinerariifolium]
LTKSIHGDVTSSQPATINDAVRLAYQLARQLIQDKTDEAIEGAMTNAAPNNNETCQKCKNKRHAGDCWKCTRCGKLGHKIKRCRISEMNCYNCQEKGHRKRHCPKLGRNGQGGNNRGGVYQLGAVNAQEDPKVVTGTFLLNNHYAITLFDSGADRSFVSTKFSTLINIKPVEIDTSYEVELADGKIVSTNNVLKGCTLNLLNHSFPIDLMVIELGSFDVIIGMYWLSKNDAAILCGEKKGAYGCILDMTFFGHNMFRFDMLCEPLCYVLMPELTSYGGSVWMHPSYFVQFSFNAWLSVVATPHCTFVSMPPRQSNCVNNEADPAFTAAVAQAVADLLLTLTARMTDEIRQNKNNGNNGNRRNSRRGNLRGSGNDEDAQPTNIHVWLERFRKEKPQTFRSVSTPVEAENWIARIEKIFEVLGCDDQFKARLATYKLEGDAHSWWMTYRQAKGGDAYVATLSWNNFRDIFFLQYFPYSKKERLAGFLGAKHRLLTLQEMLKSSVIGQRIKETTRGTKTAIVYDHQKHHHRGLIRELMIEGIVTDMETVADIKTGTDMALTDGVVIDKAVTDMVMVVTDTKKVVRMRGVTKISMIGANITVVLMGHQARADTRIITHVPHVTFVGNFIQERRVTGLLVLALNVERVFVTSSCLRTSGFWVPSYHAESWCGVHTCVSSCLVLVLIFVPSKDSLKKE